MTIKSVTLSLSFQLAAMTTTMAASSTMCIAMAHANLAFQARRPPSISSLDSASRVIRDPRPPFGFRSNSPRQKARTTAPLHLSAKTHDGGVDNESKVTSNSGPLFSQGQPSYSPDLPYEILPFREVLRLLVPPTDSHQSTHNDEHDLELERHLQTGLSSSEAKSRLERIGPNSLRPPRKKSIWELWLKQFDDGLVQILVGVALASASFSVSEVWDAVREEGGSGVAANIISSGDVSDGIVLFQAMRSFFDTIANNPSLKSTILQSFVEPSIIIAILLLNAMVGVWQDLSARSSLEALEKMQPRLATVLRSNGGNSDENGVGNGNGSGNDKNSNGAVAAGSKWITEYDATELVPGDVIKLRVGDSIPADARLAVLTSSTMYVDESSLTGESVSVGKSPWDEGISSVHVTRGEGEGASTVPIQDQSSMLFSGTLITRGSGTAVVVRTGPSTQIGRIQSTLSEAQLETEERKTPLGEQLDEFGTTLSYVIGGICLAVWLASIPRFGDSIFDSWIEGAIYYAKVGVALGVAAIPEGLPAVITLCLSLGTRRMAERNVIVRKLPSVETLGCTTTICTDKTGTLTSNQMTAVLLTLLESNGGKQNGKIEAVEYEVTGSSYSPFGSVSGIKREESISIPNGAVADANVIMTLCNDARLIGNDDIDDERETKRDGEQFTIEGEPTEASLLCLVEKLGPIDTAADFTTNTDSPESMNPSSIASRNNRYFAKNYDRYATLEFDRKRKSMSVLCSPIDEARTSTDGSCQLFVKGAPNFLLQRCNKAKLRNGEVVQLTPELRLQIDKSIVSIGDRALRCIGLAKKDGSSLDPRLWKKHEQYNDYLKDPNTFAEIESDLTFIGMVGIKDPAREGVAESIELCKRAGIRVIMITGDAKATAIAIAKDVSIFEDNLHPPTDNSQRAFEGREFFALPESQQLDTLRTGNLVICRAEPSDKQRLVKMLQSIDEIPAMTGDGVNDAPALQQASIGVAMGISGTDVAKEAADMVLVDDNFSTIVDAVEEGRCIYANMQAFINFLITCNIGEVISVFLAAILGLPQLFSPLMLLWCNLATDGPPATALGFNPPDPGLMNQKPRPTSEKILTPALLLRYTAAGLYIGIATVAVYVSYFFDHGVTFQELSTWSSCADTSSTTCSIFTDLAAPQTLALTTLVTTELLKALCTVSVDSSILTVYPWQNPWLILGVLVPFGLNLAIIYSESLGIPALGESFGLVPLQLEDWGHVLMWSIPIIFIDEALKYVFRRMNVAAVREG